MNNPHEHMIGVRKSSCNCICLQLGISIVHLSHEQMAVLLQDLWKKHPAIMQLALSRSMTNQVSEFFTQRVVS